MVRYLFAMCPTDKYMIHYTYDDCQTYSYTNLPSGVQSCRSNIMSFLCPTLSIAVTVIVTSGRLLFNPVTLRKLSTVVTTASPSIGGGDIDTS